MTVIGIDFKVKQVVEVDAGSVDNEIFVNTVNKMERLLKSFSDKDFNNKCEVHMPGQALSTYNETMVLEDCCADILQQQMGVGWRIIAVCPQPTQRRPDYILGRFNPTMDSPKNRAARY